MSVTATALRRLSWAPRVGAATTIVLAVLAMAPATACPVDEARFAAYFAAKIEGNGKFFAVNGPIRGLAYLGPAARGEIATLRDLARAGQGPTRYLALWALARIEPDDALVRSGLAEADGQSRARSLYVKLSAAAYLARAGEPGDRARAEAHFLPAIRGELRKLGKTKRSVFKEAMIAWALYEMDSPVARAEADRLTRRYVEEPFPERLPLTGIDFFEIVGPHARMALPLLFDIARGEHDISSRPFREDAARALMVVGGVEARRAFAEFVAELRGKLTREQPAIGKAVGALLDLSRDGPLAGRLDDLAELLPYSYCAQPDVEAVLERDGHGPEVYLNASAFLIGVGSARTGLLRRRLTNIASQSSKRKIRKKAEGLLEKL